MKQSTRGKQKLSKALLFSLILHIVFVATLSTVLRQLEQTKDELFVQVEIISQLRKPVPRPLKRPLRVFPASNVSTPQSIYREQSSAYSASSANHSLHIAECSS